MAEEENFRDRIATVDAEGKRKWIYPKKPSGWYYDKRKLLSYVLLLFLFAGPYLRIGGEPILQIDIIHRKFIILGQIFWPQDLYIFALMMISFIIFIALFTIIFGRLFCGWICPQTIFMEMVFRRIEYWIEGDYKKQRALDKAPWTRDKVIKKTGKHLIFWGISFLIANTFLAYIIGTEELWKIILEPPSQHIVGLIGIIVFTSLFYGVFSRFREQVCTSVCPYGRLQGVLLDKDSMVVAYDHVRGEGRAKFRKNENRSELGKGDCIDCHQCVDVCPTGIDIRDGIQLECVNCTACMDVCDFMMEHVNLPKGLIRYASEESIINKTPFIFTNRMKAYSALLLVLIGIAGTLLLTRTDFEATILRTRGTLFQEDEQGRYVNIYDISLVNKTFDEIPVTLKLIDGVGELSVIGDDINLASQGVIHTKFMIRLEPGQLKGRKTDLKVGVFLGEEKMDEVKTTFIGPVL